MTSEITTPLPAVSTRASPSSRELTVANSKCGRQPREVVASGRRPRPASSSASDRKDVSCSLTHFVARHGGSPAGASIQASSTASVY